MKYLSALLVFLIFQCAAIAQDSTGAVSGGWQTTAVRTGDGKYEVTFHASVKPGWKIYAPGQELLGTPTTALTFADSSIAMNGFTVMGKPVAEMSQIFSRSVLLYADQASWKAMLSFPNGAPDKLKGTLLYTYGRNDEFYPSTAQDFTVDLPGGKASGTRILIPTIDIDHPYDPSCGDDIQKDSSLFNIFLLGFLGGLIALITPCVFPMIPLTVSFFTKGAEQKAKGTRNAIIYGFFIFLIYVLLTVPFHIAGKTSPDIFNNISTNVWLNLAFFVIFIVFAVSFFGYFEIALPAGIANKMGSKNGTGNLAGIFFMALTLAIVSFSCTGPILGSLLAGVANGGAWPLTAGAAGFGLALGLPFALFALFPQWLHSIPKSGGWLTDVKVVLGFVELALAVKFLANADNVKQWGFLKREVFIGLWVIIGFLIVLYLLGKLHFSHSSPVKKFSKTRIAFIFLFAAATVYLIPGLTNTRWARLGLISGFPPPVCYSVYRNPVNCDKPLLDYEQALAIAKKEHKPVLIDFTGWACVNCRRMEEKVWTDPGVEALMRNDFVLVSLYVDERTPLPAAERTVYKALSGEEKSIVLVGDKWSAFQIDNFHATTQPQYAIISPDEKAMVKTKAYTHEPADFKAWLECGLNAFKKYSAEK